MSRFFALQAFSGQYHDIGVNEFFYELQRVHDTSRTMAECCDPTRYFNFRWGLAWAQVHFTIIINITHPPALADHLQSHPLRTYLCTLHSRSMVPGPWSGEIVPSKPSTAQR